MSLRSKMNSNPAITAVVVGSLIVVALWMAIRHGSGPSVAMGTKRAYYTIDDGKTYFIDSQDRVAPFQHEGKEALKAYVFLCGKEMHVGYLERYNADAHKTLTKGNEALASGQPSASTGNMATARIEGREVRKPNTTTWVSVTPPTPKCMEVMRAQCPNNEAPEPMVP